MHKKRQFLSLCETGVYNNSLFVCSFVTVIALSLLFTLVSVWLEACAWFCNVSFVVVLACFFPFIYGCVAPMIVLLFESVLLLSHRVENSGSTGLIWGQL